MITLITTVAALWFLLLCLQLRCFIRDVSYLRDVAPVMPDSCAWPKVSLIVPSCNEEKTILPAARSLVAMDYPNIEFIFINDRSTDKTGFRLKELAKEDGRVKVITVNELPKDWLGKVHALHQGVLSSNGDWLLFSDADIHYEAQALKRAISFVTKRNLDFLSVMPNFFCQTFFLKIFVAQFLHFVSMGFSMKRLEDPHSQDAFGAGVFNLVRRSAYEKSEGFTGIKMEVIDDGALAWLIKRSGARLGFLNAVSELSVKWYEDLPAMIRGVEKNGFALFQYSLPTVLLYVLGTWFIFFLTLIVPLWCTNGYVFSLYTVCFITYLAFSSIVFQRVMRYPPWISLTLPLTFPLFPLFFFRSAFLCLLRGGIRWRGTFYPLQELRHNHRLRLIDTILRKQHAPPPRRDP